MSITPSAGKYAAVNGIQMYYEVHGAGYPLVLIHGGGSTLGTSFGRVIPLLAKQHLVIAVELQNHGHSGVREEPQTFVQDAADVVELLQQLNIPKADILGFSNGGQTTMQVAMTYPQKVNRLVIASAFYSRDGVFSGFWDGFAGAQLNQLPQIYQDAFAAINADPAALLNMFNKDVERMRNFKGWADEEIRAIHAPTLIIAGDRDMVTAEHTVTMHRLLRGSRLAILPATHGSYMGEAMTPDVDSKQIDFFVGMVDEFLLGQ